ncbi:MAG: amidohydrolase family protein [Dehalococcoidia bacterium]
MIIDSHCHILPESFPQRLAQLREMDATLASLFPVANPKMATAESLLREMDRAGVDQAVVMGMGWSDLNVAQEVNNYIIESASRYRDRLTGFCSVNPVWGAPAVAELRRCLTAGLGGLGELHADTQGFDITRREEMTPLMEVLQQQGLPVVVHVSEPAGHQYPGKGQTTPDRAYRFIENFPDNIIICAHWGGGLPFYALMPEVGEVFKNVYFDTAASPFLYLPEIFSTVANLVGSEKILFGTDHPLIAPQRVLAQVRETIDDPVDLQNILGENARRLLGR